MSVGRKIHIIYMIGMIAILGVSCTDVELCYESEHPHSAQVTIKYDWRTYTEKPDSMFVVVSRPLNTYHDYFSVDHQGNSLDSTGTIRTAIPMKSGEYFMITCNNDKLVDVVNLDSFRVNASSFSLEDLTLSMQFLERKDVPQLDSIDWIDFNPGYKYVSNAGAIYANVQNYITLYTGGAATVTFQPDILTQDIHFEFRIESDGKVEIDSAMCEIAGVCPYLNPYSGAVKTEKERSGKMIFFPQKEQNGNITTFKGKISAFGLIGGKDSTAVAGPGIMQIAIFVKSGEQQRILRAGANISKKIDEAGLLMLTDDGSGDIIQAKKEAHIIIMQPLEVNGNEISKPKEDGISTWIIDKENSNIDIDI